MIHQRIADFIGIAAAGEDLSLKVVSMILAIGAVVTPVLAGFGFWKLSHVFVTRESLEELNKRHEEVQKRHEEKFESFQELIGSQVRSSDQRWLDYAREQDKRWDQVQKALDRINERLDAK